MSLRIIEWMGMLVRNPDGLIVILEKRYHILHLVKPGV